MTNQNAKKLLKVKNKYFKIVHNLKHTRFNKFQGVMHIVSKEIILAYSSMTPIYNTFENDFQQVDLVDLEMYERWLNG